MTGLAAVVADSPYIAADALDLITVDYDVLPVVVDARSTMDDGQPLVHDDVSNNLSYHWPSAMPRRPRKHWQPPTTSWNSSSPNQRLIPNAMEPRACVAEWDAFEEFMTVSTTSQNPHTIRLLLAAFTLGVPEHKLRVISPDVGGGFGSKISHYGGRGHRSLGVDAAESTGQVGGDPDRVLRDRCAWPRPRDESPPGAERRRDHHGPPRDDVGQYGCLSVDVRPADPNGLVHSAPLGPVQDPGDHGRGVSAP